jgi:hypothetical protein
MEVKLGLRESLAQSQKYRYDVLPSVCVFSISSKSGKKKKRMCVCVCVCVCERERERQRERCIEFKVDLK